MKIRDLQGRGEFGDTVHGTSSGVCADLLELKLGIDRNIKCRIFQNVTLTLVQNLINVQQRIPEKNL